MLSIKRQKNKQALDAMLGTVGEMQFGLEQQYNTCKFDVCE